MPTHSAEAVVLRQYSLAEADRIVVFFSREYGKIRAVAKGAKKLRSRLGGCLEPLNQIQIEFFAREGSDLGRITRCEMLHSYLGSNPAPENMVLLSYLGEIINEIVQENNPNPLLYRLFLATLKAGEKTGMNESLVRYFEFWSLKLSGLLPNYDYCSNCSRCVKDVGFYAWFEAGQARCEECAGNKGIRIRPVAAKTLQAIWELSPEQFASRPLAAAAAGDLERLSRKLLEWHLEKQLKSLPAVRAVFSDRQDR
jgi:DNA repair protein RecO (recombination protein O)